MTKYFKNAIQVALVYALIVIQLSFVSSWSYPFYLINFPLLLLIVIIVLGKKDYYLYLAVLLGFVFDVFSFNVFSLYIISFVLTAIFSRYLQLSFFTNRSIYSFILITAFTTVIFNFLFQIIDSIFKIYQGGQDLFLTQVWFWQAIGYKLVLHSIVIVILFYIINFTTRRLRPYLLENK
jgi:rod shape-determining protein MreD